MAARPAAALCTWHTTRLLHAEGQRSQRFSQQSAAQDSGSPAKADTQVRKGNQRVPHPGTSTRVSSTSCTKRAPSCCQACLQERRPPGESCSPTKPLQGPARVAAAQLEQFCLSLLQENRPCFDLHIPAAHLAYTLSSGETALAQRSLQALCCSSTASCPRKPGREVKII